MSFTREPYFDRTGATYDAARTEYGLGVALARSGQLAPAVARYEATLARWRQLGDAGMEAELLNCLGCAYGYQGDYERARAFLHESLTRAREEGYQLTEGATLHSLGEVLLAAGDLAGARAAFDQGLAVMQDLGELWVITALYDAIALTTAFEGDLRRAEEHAHHAISLAQRQESPYFEAICSLTLGAIQTRSGRARGLATLNGAAETLIGLGAQRETARAHLWLAQALYASGDAEASISHIHTAFALATALGSDSILDLHVRWDRAPFEAAAESGVETARLRAVMDRAGQNLPAEAGQPADHALPALIATGFGGGSLAIEGRGPVDFLWDKARELFFYLLHSGPRRQDQVTAALWPDSLTARARTALHTAAYRLRRATDPRVLLLRGGVYRIDEELLLHYDVREFERLVQATGTGHDQAALGALQRAVELYVAPFLDHLDAEWCVEERDRLERLFQLALERLSDALAAAGRLQDAIGVAGRLLTLDPWREDVQARVIRAHLRLGDRPAALRQYDQCVIALREELGIAPGPELRALGSRIRAN